jgi:hypothetical protein
MAISWSYVFKGIQQGRPYGNILKYREKNCNKSSVHMQTQVVTEKKLTEPALAISKKLCVQI